jgi:hypothetical protein
MRELLADSGKGFGGIAVCEEKQRVARTGSDGVAAGILDACS